MEPSDRNWYLGIAGEFLVAGELHRRHIRSVIIYGNAKKADIVAVNGSRSVIIEVKSSPRSKWVISRAPPEKSDVIWALVYIPRDHKLPPQYFILTDEELREAVNRNHSSYLEAYRTRNGREFTGVGVYKVARDDSCNRHENGWDKVLRALNITKT